MLTQRTKRQLLVFVFITLIGVSYVGARYAKLDRLVYDTSYQVNAHFEQSGGIFTGAEVTYRGVGVGRVTDMQLIENGVNVVLSIEKGTSKIPADTLALVGNKSAVGEQYVELQPQVDNGPYLKDGSVIEPADTEVPVSTTEILTNLDRLITSVPQDQLRTVVSELGDAFQGTGADLARIIDTSNSFIQTANDNFDVTSALIRDGSKVLKTQVDKGSAIRSFARDLSLFSTVLADNDESLRRLIDNGSATAIELRTFLEQNQVDLGSLINNLVTTGDIIVKHLPGIRQVLVLYPYIVAGGFTVVAKNAEGYNARFGFILNQFPAVCHQGYDPKERRSPTDGSNKPMDEDAGCTEPARKTNARGAQNAPRTGTSYGTPMATYDLDTRTTTWSDQAPAQRSAGATVPLSREDALQYLLFRSAS
ncbi:MCE family protein [Nocardioides marmoriginsengisoli]|uniref:MCE family protein n=1 Tax=Nocardioides marmoriginsengisoli TaxID=661483 RepID=A0A3N0CCJ1_9ACTN|nr:MlaD family protein [Nocardioides marmoriginsengisoli]RNL60703.1 MCE family protein [Nocardioides marmoriginsengisoli]